MTVELLDTQCFTLIDSANKNSCTHVYPTVEDQDFAHPLQQLSFGL